MCKFRLFLTAGIALIAVMQLPGPAQAAPWPAPGQPRLVSRSTMIERAHSVWGRQGYCWYDEGWNGAGWYRCGYASRDGKGWGGAQG